MSSPQSIVSEIPAGQPPVKGDGCDESSPKRVKTTDDCSAYTDAEADCEFNALSVLGVGRGMDHICDIARKIRSKSADRLANVSLDTRQLLENLEKGIFAATKKLSELEFRVTTKHGASYSEKLVTGLSPDEITDWVLGDIANEMPEILREIRKGRCHLLGYRFPMALAEKWRKEVTPAEKEAADIYPEAPCCVLTLEALGKLVALRRAEFGEEMERELRKYYLNGNEDGDGLSQEDD